MPRSKSTNKKKYSSLRTAVRTSGPAVAGGITPAEVLEPLLWLLESVGVTRRQVLATVRALPPVKLPAPVTVVRGQLEYWSRTLIRWSSDPRFLGPDGRPRDLPFLGRVPSFSELVALVLPPERPATCRDVLLATGAIIQLPNRRLRLRDRAALATGAESGVILADEYLRPLRALLLALQTNLLHRAKGIPSGPFQRAVSGFEISPGDMVQLRGFVARHGTALLETVDDWLVHRQREQSRSGHARQDSVRPYLGLYLSTDSGSAELTLENTRPGRTAVRKRRLKAPRS